MLIPGDEGEKRTKGGKTERRAKTKKKRVWKTEKRNKVREKKFFFACLNFGNGYENSFLSLSLLS